MITASIGGLVRRVFALLAIALVAAGPVAPAAFAAARVDQSDLEDEVMCVQCGRPLSTSSGSAADQERALIQGWIDQGLTKAQIKDRLVGEYGQRALVNDTSPVAAAAPWIAAIVGASSIVLLLRRRRQRDLIAADAPASPGPTPADHDPADAAPEISAADAARIEAELSDRG